MQRTQAAVLNTLTESRQFDKIKISKKSKDDQARVPGTRPHSDSHAVTVLWENTPAKAVPGIQQDVCGVQQGGILQEGMLQQKEQGGQ